MRILNVTAQKPDSTGSGVYLAQLVRCQVQAGHEAAVLCGVDAADDPAAALPAGVRLYPVRFNTPELPFSVCGMSDQMPYAATRYRDLTPSMAAAFKQAFSARIREALEQFAPDVIVCHHLYLVTALVRQLAGSVPVYAICHSTDLRQMRSHGLERAFIVEQVRALDGIFALHGAQAAELVEAYGCQPERARVLGTGFDAGTFTRTNAPREDGALELLYVGKIWAKKGVGCLLEALDAFEPGPQGARLRLVGGHNDEAEYARLAARARACRLPVQLVGPLRPEKLAVRYQRADVFVLPSFYEGLPLVVVEALACGCRVVVSDLPGIRPWLSAVLPDAPVVYVQPPRMRTVDEPYEEDLPAFSQRIARALQQAAALPPCTCDMGALSWEGLTSRLLGMLQTGPRG